MRMNIKILTLIFVESLLWAMYPDLLGDERT